MPTIKNGVNVDNLLTAIEAVKDDPANGKLTFTVRSNWKNGSLLARHNPQKTGRKTVLRLVH